MLNKYLMNEWSIFCVGATDLSLEYGGIEDVFMLSHSVMSDSVITWTIARQVPLAMGFPRQEHWSGLLFPHPGDLPNPGIEPVSPASPALQVDYIPLSHWGRPSIEDMGVDFRMGQIWLWIPGSTISKPWDLGHVICLLCASYASFVKQQ